MLTRAHDPQDAEAGFTLIELLVVMIIIGILAAIAIPAFLSQRDKGYRTAVKNDLKNVSIAEESYATDNNGSYEAGDAATDTNLSSNGAKLTQGVTVTAYVSTNAAKDSYCLVGSSSKTTEKYVLKSSNNATDDAGTTAPTDYASCELK